jgi:hypothetical protein
MYNNIMTKNAKTTRGKPFQSGNPGRPKGSRNKATLAVEALLDGEAETLTRMCVQKALGGDMTALKLCLDRICPPRKDRPVRLDLPTLRTADNLVDAMIDITKSVSVGNMTPSEAQAMAGLIETTRRAIETCELEKRLTELEAAKL